MKNVIGVVNLQEENKLIKELAATRAIEALPFAGRYRLVDFALSNMVNSRINAVGLLLPNFSRAILDHVRSGKDWDLARRRDGLTYLPTALPDNDSRKGDLKNIYFNLDFVELSGGQYVILTNASYVYNIDFENVLNLHKKSDCDISVIYSIAQTDHSGRSVIVEVSTNGIVTDLAGVSDVKQGNKEVMGAYIMPVPTFAYLVRSSYEHGGQDFLFDALIRHASEFKISAYKHEGYVAHINSTVSYYIANRDCLRPEIWEELFMNEERPIFTKIKDEVPVQYKATSNVKNCLVANGCEISGTIENSIIFRGVKVGRGAVVKDSILMQRCDIQEGARVENVICDKNVIVTKNRWLKGVENYPYIITKNVRI